MGFIEVSDLFETSTVNIIRIRKFYITSFPQEKQARIWIYNANIPPLRMSVQVCNFKHISNEPALSFDTLGIQLSLCHTHQHDIVNLWFLKGVCATLKNTNFL